MKPKANELGRLLVDAGDVVCFSYDQVMRLAEKLGISDDALIRRFEGVACNFGADGNYGVDSLTAVTTDGKTHPVVMIGGDPETFLRFLGDDEQGFGEFYKAHPKYAQVGKGEQFNRELFDTIVKEHAAKLLAHGKPKKYREIGAIE